MVHKFNGAISSQRLLNMNYIHWARQKIECLKEQNKPNFYIKVSKIKQ